MQGSIMLVKRTLMLHVLFTRFVLFIIQFFSSSLDFTTDAFRGVAIQPESLNTFDRIVLRTLSGFNKWDSIHMIHIARYGYVLESSLAFFPFYPLTLRYLTRIWSGFFINVQLIHPISALLMTAVSVNLVCFCVSALYVYKIIIEISKSEKQAAIGTILFACNPASVFFSAFYTESLYSMVTFIGIHCLLVRRGGYAHFLLSTLCFSISFATRSNGILNLGYVAFYIMLELPVLGKKDEPVFSVRDVRKLFVSAVVACFRIVFAGISIILPVYLHSEYQKKAFCVYPDNLLSGELKNLADEEDVPYIGQPGNIGWCSHSSLPFPAFYSTIQEKYWNVGLFGYWQLRKIPCFLMAMPALLITFYGSYKYICHVSRSLHTVLLDSGDLIPFCLHSLFLALSALFLYNVEVFTRMVFSSSPFLYLLLARWLSHDTPAAHLVDVLHPTAVPFLPYYCQKGPIQFAFVCYFFGYFLIGTVMHSMGLPFT